MPCVTFKFCHLVFFLKFDAANDAQDLHIRLATLDRHVSFLVDLRELYRFEQFYGPLCLCFSHFVVLSLQLVVVSLVVPVLRMLKHLSKFWLLVHAAQEDWHGTDMSCYECLGQDRIDHSRCEELLASRALILVEHRLC